MLTYQYNTLQYFIHYVVFLKIQKQFYYFQGFQGSVDTLSGRACEGKHDIDYIKWQLTC